MDSNNNEAAIQGRFNKSNHIYKITSDIDLQGGTLTIPSGCTLDFLGGSFSNGTIEFNNTHISSVPVSIIKNCTISGNLNNTELFPEWFYTTNYSDAIQSCINIASISTTRNNVNIIFQSNKDYTITTPILIDKIRINFIGNNCNFIKTTSDVGEGTFTLNDNNISLEVNCFFYSNRNLYFINITDINLLVIDLNLLNKVYGFYFPYINRSTIKNIKSLYLIEGITTIDSWQNIFENIIFDYCSNIGFNITGGTSTHINKCWVTHANISYYISSLYYSTLTCCASDYSKISYQITDCSIVLNGCGSELTNDSFTILMQRAKGIFNGYFFTGDSNNTKPLMAFIENSYAEFNACEFRNTCNLLQNYESTVILNNSKANNWGITFNSGTIIKNDSNAQYVFREESGNIWNVQKLFNSSFSTSKRPNLTANDYGVIIYDITIKKMIMWNGTAWVNLDGTSLT